MGQAQPHDDSLNTGDLLHGGVPRSLDDVHAELDAIDRALIEHLSRRFALMRDPAHFQRAGNLSDEAWHRQLILAARKLAFEQNVPVGLVADMWDRLTDASIALQRQAHARLRVITE
jgi:isochorismate pyruvate lyase